MEASDQEIRDAAIIDCVKDIAFGSVAGMVSKVFEHPLDLCKVRLQAQVLDHVARFSGPWDCLSSTWRDEGIRGLYRGLPAPIVGAMAENASLFLTYRQLQRLCRWWSGSNSTDFLRPSQLAISAAGAGAVTSFILTPIELVKCKMQVQLLALESLSPSSSAVSPTSPAVAMVEGVPLRMNSSNISPSFHELPGPLAVLRSIVRTHGLRGLWLGQTATLIRETGGSAAWFGTKEVVSSLLLRMRERRQHGYDRGYDVVSSAATNKRSTLRSKDLLAWESALAGAVAGVAYNVILFPADSVKSIIQTAEELRRGAASAGAGASSGLSPKSTNSHYHHDRPSSFWGVAREIYAKGGVRGLYAGCGITTLRAIPSSAIIFLIYDGLSKRFS